MKNNQDAPEEDRFPRSKSIVIFRIFHPKIGLFNVYNLRERDLHKSKAKHQIKNQQYQMPLNTVASGQDRGFNSHQERQQKCTL